MSGLFELQLPKAMAGRRSQQSAERRSESPPPEITAQRIVSQVAAKQATGSTSPIMSSIFPWRRKATSGPSKDRVTSVSTRASTEFPSRHTSSLAPIQTTRDQPVAGPSTPDSSRPNHHHKLPHPTNTVNRDSTEERTSGAAKALAQASLGLSLPPVTFPKGAQSSSLGSSPAMTTSRKKPLRPVTSQGPEDRSPTSSSLSVTNLRRATSFSKPGSERPDVAKGRDINVSHIDSTQSSDLQMNIVSPSPPLVSNDSSQILLSDRKGKQREQLDVDYSLTSLHGRLQQATHPAAIVTPDSNDNVATRRTSWWPARRRTNSLQSPPSPKIIIRPAPPLPPKSPSRLLGRRPSTSSGAPAIPTIAPFSPFSGNFDKGLVHTESPGSLSETFKIQPEDLQPHDRVQHSADEEAKLRRRHSTSQTPRMDRSILPRQNISNAPNDPDGRKRPRPRSYTVNSPAPTEVSVMHESMVDLGNSAHSKSVVPQSITRQPLLLRSPEHQSSHSLSTPTMVIDDALFTGASATTGGVSDPTARPRLESSTKQEKQSSSQHPAQPSMAPSVWATGTQENVSRSSIQLQRTPSTSSHSTSNSLSAGHARPRSTTSPELLTSQQSIRKPRDEDALLLLERSSHSPPPGHAEEGGVFFTRVTSSFYNPNIRTAGIPSYNQSTGDGLSGQSLRASSSVTLLSYSGGSESSSPRRSKEHVLGSGKPSLEISRGKPPEPMTDETARAYTVRLANSMSKMEVAHALTSRGDPFMIQALRAYLDLFKFKGDPLDVALRKLLMDFSLPKETQQIDRVMEAFAARYSVCNPGLFPSEDQPYVLAFSLMMLHTDAFNKSNKNKMSKADYIKNTTTPGVIPEVLDCFYDNIVFAPFIYIEDTEDALGSSLSFHDHAGKSTAAAPSSMMAASMPGGASLMLSKATKIDPYFLIAENMLDPLRASVEGHVQWSNPFLYKGTTTHLDVPRLQSIFARARFIDIGSDPMKFSLTGKPSQSDIVSLGSVTPRRKSVAIPSAVLAYGPFMGVSPLGSEVRAPLSHVSPKPKGSNTRWTLRITRAGVLARKDDLLEGGRKATSRKWKEWSIVLTASQLLLFRDINLAYYILGKRPPDGTQVVFPELALMNPDEVVSLHDAIAVFDKTYVKYRNTFRLVTGNGRQFLFQTPDEDTMNEWILMINYAAAIKTAQIQLRTLGLDRKDVEMTGVAAATAHLHDLAIPSNELVVPSSRLVPGANSDDDLGQPQQRSSTSLPEAHSESVVLQNVPPLHQVDLEEARPPQAENAAQFKLIFDEVKAVLAGDIAPSKPLDVGTSSRPNEEDASGEHADVGENSQISTSQPDMNYAADTSRMHTLQAHLLHLKDQIFTLRETLEAELRIARNLAILTPFQQASRVRVQAAVVPVAQRVRSIHVVLARATCHRDILKADLAHELQYWQQAKMDALYAATSTLGSTEPEPSRSRDAHALTPVSSNPRVEEEAAEVTIQQDSPVYPRENSSVQSPPSASQSFYSAIDHLVDADEALMTPLSVLDEVEEAYFPYPDAIPASNALENSITSTVEMDLNDRSLSETDSPIGHHERYYTALETPEEIAEEWNATRAAKRVSLVRLPADVKPARRSSRQQKSMSS